jgi:hypothetical protein
VCPFSRVYILYSFNDYRISSSVVCSVNKTPHLLTTILSDLTDGPEKKGNR